MASYFIGALIEIFMFRFNEIKSKWGVGGGWEYPARLAFKETGARFLLSTPGGWGAGDFLAEGHQYG